MRVGADRDRHAESFCGLEMAPVEVESMWIGVELDGHAEGGRLLEHRLDIDGVWLARQEQSSGGMCEDRQVWVVERAKHAAGHRRPVH